MPRAIFLGLQDGLKGYEGTLASNVLWKITGDNKGIFDRELFILYFVIP